MTIYQLILKPRFAEEQTPYQNDEIVSPWEILTCKTVLLNAQAFHIKDIGDILLVLNMH